MGPGAVPLLPAHGHGRRGLGGKAGSRRALREALRRAERAVHVHHHADRDAGGLRAHLLLHRPHAAPHHAPGLRPGGHAGFGGDPVRDHVQHDREHRPADLLRVRARRQGDDLHPLLGLRRKPVRLRAIAASLSLLRRVGSRRQDHRRIRRCGDRAAHPRRELHRRAGGRLLRLLRRARAVPRTARRPLRSRRDQGPAAGRARDDPRVSRWLPRRHVRLDAPHVRRRRFLLVLPHAVRELPVPARPRSELDPEHQRRGEDFFAQLYASVYTSSSLVALAIQSFITSGLLRRIGIAWVLFALPLWFLGTYAAAAYWGLTLVTGVALQLGERIWIPALHRPASELVYSQVSAAIRPRARAFLSGGVNAFGNMVAALSLIFGLRAVDAGLFDVRTLLGIGASLSLVYVYNAWHTRRLFGRRIAQNLTSPDPDLRRNAADMLASESSAVPEDVLRSLGGHIPADVEHGVRLALTRRGILAVAADVTDSPRAARRQG